MYLQSKIISTDAMFAIVDAVNLWNDSHFPLEDSLRNIHKLKPDGGMKGTSGGNVWGDGRISSGSGGMDRP